MAENLTIGRDGSFELEGRAYQIPECFSAREVFSYRRLLEPIPDIPGGTALSREQRSRQRAYFFRRAAAAIIPGLEPSTLETLTLPMLLALHRWIAAHRPELTLEARISA